MSLFARIGVLIGVLGVGILGRRIGLLTEPVTDRLNTVAFYVVLPGLVFDSTYDASLSTLLSPSVVVGQVIVTVAIAAIAVLVHRRVGIDGRRSVAIVQSYHGNLGYLGLPIVATTLDPAAAGTASVILGVGLLLQVPMTVSFLTVIASGDSILRREIGRIVYNPVLIGLGCGLVVSFFGVSIPPVAAGVTSGLGSVALPVALLLVGSSLEFDLPDGEFGTLGTVLSLKLFVMPAIAWVTYSTLEVSGTALAAGVVMFGAPTAISTYIYTQELGGDDRFASRTIFATTMVWTLTVFGLVELVG